MHLLIVGLATYVGAWCFTSWFRDASLTLGRLMFLAVLIVVGVVAAVTAPTISADATVPVVGELLGTVADVAGLGLLLGAFGIGWWAGHASAA